MRKFEGTGPARIKLNSKLLNLKNLTFNLFSDFQIQKDKQNFLKLLLVPKSLVD